MPNLCNERAPQTSEDAMNATPAYLLLIAGLILASTRDAAAYIDPGSSSYVFQLLIAGLTAVVFFFSSIKRSVVAVFRRGNSSSKKDRP
jgi:hypothetical protein